MKTEKIGFWAVFALVAGSQIGSGVFVQPASLAPYGLYALAGWLISGTGAVTLALVFGWLCSKFPRTGGPYAYVEEAFGPVAGFFTGWTYWVISWVSTPVLYVASVGYLSPMLGNPPTEILLGLEIILLLALTWLNLRGVYAAGRAEFVLSLLKIIPLIIMPILALMYFKMDNFTVDTEKVAGSSLSHILSSVALLTMWGFIGLETATTAAGSVENPQKVIPRAIVIGTLCVGILYFFNSLGIMGLMAGAELAQSRAPYADAAQHMFGGNWHLLISLIASVVCIGTANAWTLSSGQAALGLAEAGLMPAIFKQKNKFGAPRWGILSSCIGIIPILILTANETLSEQINTIIDFSVTAFIFVYFACVAAFFRISYKERTLIKHLAYLIAACIGGFFCLWVLFETSWHTIGIASLFAVSGIPIFFLLPRRSN
ncbi:MAG: amino acid permease [Myxococcales bacterium]|nr:amino acid permease [Myxococcales bacterium]USN51377.1 MAG: amino acid permease [Myxococcales bacterium]